VEAWEEQTKKTNRRSAFRFIFDDDIKQYSSSGSKYDSNEQRSKHK